MRRVPSAPLVLSLTPLLLLLAVACTATTDPAPSGASPGGKADGPGSDESLDVRHMDLELDLEALRARARIAVAASGGQVDLEIGDLLIESVHDGHGEPLAFKTDGGHLMVQVEPDETAHDAEVAEVEVLYAFREHSRSDGYLPAAGVSLLWPYFCRNLFPCNPSPRDGLTFTLDVTGVAADDVAIFPSSVEVDAPPYMLAFAVGDYVYDELGTTAAGTRVGVYAYRGEEDDAREATSRLAATFEFFEQTYGPYAFGSDVASVSADWGGGAYGGMEHHPFWHVARAAMTHEVTHVHEAAHGWFGNGVRIRCWEDFVVSEGVTSYAAARALTVVGGEAHGAEVWAAYARDLERAVASGDTLARPEGCGEIDILHDPLWSSVPYMKGAFFLRAVADEVGAETLDEALGVFYRAHVGQVAGIEDLLDAIEESAGFDARPLAREWLEMLGIPAAP